jgi:hypothetical protein
MLSLARHDPGQINMYRQSVKKKEPMFSFFVSFDAPSLPNLALVLLFFLHKGCLSLEVFSGPYIP